MSSCRVKGLPRCRATLSLSPRYPKMGRWSSWLKLSLGGLDASSNMPKSHRACLTHQQGTPLLSCIQFTITDNFRDQRLSLSKAPMGATDRFVSSIAWYCLLEALAQRSLYPCFETFCRAGERTTIPQQRRRLPYFHHQQGQSPAMSVSYGSSRAEVSWRCFPSSCRLSTQSSRLCRSS